jgi:hypothetical protein
MPTLGEFVRRANQFGYTKHTIRIPEFRTNIVYLRRGQAERADLVELPPVAESTRLTREVVSRLCAATGIPQEDFGLGG